MDKNKLIHWLLWGPIIILGILNLLTVFTPEIGFDALWYHLTLPKLWLLKKQWYFDGGLMYYSVMPRLSETIFIPLIKMSGFIGPKLVQYLSGIITCVLIWKISNYLKLSKIYRLIAISLFYCTWLVSWESGSAYIDLIRTMIETAALFLIITGSWKQGGLVLGLAVGTKWMALLSVVIYSLVFNPLILVLALFVALPWFVIAFQFTGNPIFPIFSGVIHNSVLSIDQIFKNFIFSPYMFTKPYDDFLSPLIGLVFIFSVVAMIRSPKIRKVALIGIFGSLSSLILDPPSSRFLLPYLPALIISSVYGFAAHFDKYQKYLITLVVLSSLLVLSARIYAIKKYIPYLLGQENLSSFLTRYATRLPGTFIDSDGFVANEIPKNSKILVDKIHNLYYFPSDFDHTSWVKSWQGYDYLVTMEENPANIKGILLNTNLVGIQTFRLNK